MRRAAGIGWRILLGGFLLVGCRNLTLPTTPTTLTWLNETTIEYFLDLAFGAEYGVSTNLLRTWHTPLRLVIHGDPAPEDLSAVSQVVEELNVLLQNTEIRLQPTDPDPNVRIRYIDQAGFDWYAPPHARRYAGYVVVRWNEVSQIEEADILIRKSLSPTRRAHVLREELTQALGLLNDSYVYPQSIFYQQFSETTAYADIDAAVLRIWDLCYPLVGYSEEQVRRILYRTLYRARTTWSAPADAVSTP